MGVPGDEGLDDPGFAEEESMQYAIELYFDKESEQNLANLAQLVADRKLSTKFLEWKTRPHLTLTCFNRFFYKASNLVLHEFKKMSGKFVSVGLVKISFPVEEIYTVDLGA